MPPPPSSAAVARAAPASPGAGVGGAARDWALTTPPKPPRTAREDSVATATSASTVAEGPAGRVRTWIAHNLTFFRLHLLYFILLGEVGAVAIYLLEGARLPFIDVLFTCNSAVTVTGLATIDVASLTRASQAIILILIVAGGTALASAAPVLIRRHYFEAKAAEAVEDPVERGRILDEQTTEYRALNKILVLVLLYWAVVQLVVFVGVGIAIVTDDGLAALMDRNGVSGWWWAFFHALSSFSNAGLSLFSDNLIPVASSYSVLLLLSVGILLGNTGFPIAMRFLVWACHRLWPQDEAYKLLLDRPRKCFTHMFKSAPTWRLLAFSLALLFLQFIAFLALDFNDKDLLVYSPAVRALVGWFQSVCTRTAGFNVLDLSAAKAGMQVVYAWMMYLAAYPVLLTIRKSTDKDAAARQAAVLAVELKERDADVDAVLASEGLALGPDFVEVEVEDESSLATTRRESVVEYAIEGEAGSHGEGTGTGTGTGAGPVPPLAMGPLRRASLGLLYALPPAAAAAAAAAAATVPRAAAPAAAASSSSVHALARLPAAVPPPLALAVPRPQAGRETVRFDARDRAGDCEDKRAGPDVTPAGFPTPSRWGSSSVGGESTLELRALDPERTMMGGAGADGGGGATALASAAEPPTLLVQTRNIISRDLPMLFVALVLITIAESSKIGLTDTTGRLGVWPIFFEVVSAFGTVGLSLGYPGTPLSLSAVLTPFSKLVLIAVMLAGRHRGLPSSIDPAVFLPALLNRAVTRPPPVDLDPAALKTFGRAVVRAASFSAGFGMTPSRMGSFVGGRGPDSTVRGDGDGDGGGRQTVRVPRTAGGSTRRLQPSSARKAAANTLPAALATDLAAAARAIAAAGGGGGGGGGAGGLAAAAGGAGHGPRRSIHASESLTARVRDFRKSLMGAFEGAQEGAQTATTTARRESVGGTAGGLGAAGGAGGGTDATARGDASGEGIEMAPRAGGEGAGGETRPGERGVEVVA
jgi:Trk-type K+ transport system membrane component